LEAKPPDGKRNYPEDRKPKMKQAEAQQKMVVGLAQLNAGADQKDNIRSAVQAITELSSRGADLIMLPEHADFIGSDEDKKGAAEIFEKSTYLAELRNLAVKLGRYIHVGSFLEKSEDGIYNSSAVFNPAGEVIARYRKIHLFDVEIPGGKTYLESAVISPGTETVSFSIGAFTFGMAICYDLRFPELFRRLTAAGANVLLLPAAFTLQTGRDHWEILLRARAIENQCWVAAAGQWGTAPPNHVCFGRSMVINPWGLVTALAPDGVSTIIAELDLQALGDIRTRFPALNHVRDDVFSI
jgi:nitrilase